MAVAETTKVSFLAATSDTERMQAMAEARQLKFSDVARAAFREYVERDDQPAEASA